MADEAGRGPPDQCVSDSDDDRDASLPPEGHDDRDASLPPEEYGSDELASGTRDYPPHLEESRSRLERLDVEGGAESSVEGKEIIASPLDRLHAILSEAGPAVDTEAERASFGVLLSSASQQAAGVRHGPQEDSMGMGLGTSMDGEEDYEGDHEEIDYQGEYGGGEEALQAMAALQQLSEAEQQVNELKNRLRNKEVQLLQVQEALMSYEDEMHSRRLTEHSDDESADELPREKQDIKLRAALEQLQNIDCTSENLAEQVAPAAELMQRVMVLRKPKESPILQAMSAGQSASDGGRGTADYGTLHASRVGCAMVNEIQNALATGLDVARSSHRNIQSWQVPPSEQADAARVVRAAEDSMLGALATCADLEALFVEIRNNPAGPSGSGPLGAAAQLPAASGATAAELAIAAGGAVDVAAEVAADEAIMAISDLRDAKAQLLQMRHAMRYALAEAESKGAARDEAERCIAQLQTELRKAEREASARRARDMQHEVAMELGRKVVDLQAEFAVLAEDLVVSKVELAQLKEVNLQKDHLIKQLLAGEKGPGVSEKPACKPPKSDPSRRCASETPPSGGSISRTIKWMIGSSPSPKKLEGPVPQPQ